MKSIDRLHEYLSIKGIKPTRFEKDIGLSNGYLGTQKRRKANLGEEILNKIIDNCLDLNPIWLLKGQGEMFNYTAIDTEANSLYIDRVVHELISKEGDFKKNEIYNLWIDGKIKDGIIEYLKSKLNDET